MRNEKAFKRLDKNGDGKISNPPTPNQKAINPKKLIRPLTKKVLRDLDPVELTGADVPQLLGKTPSMIVAFRFQKSWEQVPIQIDERVKTGLARLRGRKGRDGPTAIEQIDEKKKPTPEESGFA